MNITDDLCMLTDHVNTFYSFKCSKLQWAWDWSLYICKFFSETELCFIICLALVRATPFVLSNYKWFALMCKCKLLRGLMFKYYMPHCFLVPTCTYNFFWHVRSKRLQKIWILPSQCLSSILLHVRTQEPLNRFSWSTLLGCCTTVCWHTIFVNSRQQ
jgi:hypothetical protein